MKITVLNGSPKGDVSVTMQYVKYLQHSLKEHEFKVFHVSQKIKSIEKNEEKFDEIIKEVESSDGVIWDSPVYFFLIPSQLKRFIELVFERNAGEAFQGKYATYITSSMHFYDHTAHNYINGISDDLGMKYMEGFPVEMQDLLKEENQKQLKIFGKNFVRHIEEKIPVEKKFKPIDYSVREFNPGEIKEVEKSGDKTILISTDAGEDDVNLNRMIDVFVKLSPVPVEIMNLNDIKVKGGCLGCCKCCDKGVCVYKDEFHQYYEEKFLKADLVITAASIKDRFFSSRWKMFYDRQFYNGHRPITHGKQMGYIISGPLDKVPNLREIMHAMAEVGKMNCTGVVTDEINDDQQIVSLLGALSKNMIWNDKEGYKKPWSYLGKGGHLIFRDLVYASRSFLKADYEYYKKEGLLDYPQSDFKKEAETTLFSLMMAIPQVREETYKNPAANMVKPFEKILAEV